MSYRSPGVFNKEIDESLYVQQAASSVAGMVGVADKGPIGDPTLVTNWPQFVETFGGFRQDSYLAYAAKSFFDNGGGVLYVVRTAHYTDPADASTLVAAASTIDVLQTDGTTVAATATAKSEGTWADGYSVEIVVDGAEFTVIVKDDGGNELERFAQLQDTDATADRYADTVVTDQSRYISYSTSGATPVAQSVSLAGGDDGLAGLVDADYIGSSAAKTGMYAFDDVESIKLVAVPGVETPALHAALITYVEGRGTAVAVLGTPQGLSPSEAIDYRMGTGAYAHASFNSSYSALYWPWLKVYDPLTKTNIEIPVEGAMMGVIARSDAETQPWFAPAGLNRGVLRNVLGVEYTTTQGERDEAYSNQVNVLANFKGEGVVVWGQKTVVTKPSALDRVNVRRLLNLVKESMADTAKFLLFEPNDPRTWNAFKRFANPFLQNIKEQRGVYDYLVVCDETTNTPYYIDRNQMVAKIFIKPTKAIEFLEIQYIVTGTGANFEEL